MAFEDLDGELEGYSLEELQEIHDTQQDLYSAEEIEHMASFIASRRDALDDECRRLEAMVEERLPEEMECQKCGGPNEFTNVKCKFCGAALDKSEYYDDARAVLYGEVRDGFHADDRLRDEAFSRFFAEEEAFDDGEGDARQPIAVPSAGEKSYTFHYVISVVIPLVGFIMGGILLTKEDEEDRFAGKVCIVAGIISTVIGYVLWSLYLNSITY